MAFDTTTGCDGHATLFTRPWDRAASVLLSVNLKSASVAFGIGAAATFPPRGMRAIRVGRSRLLARVGSLLNHSGCWANTAAV
jgi:hypothetical protein